MQIEEIEQSFQCPYCLETISFLLDVSQDGSQTYVEDCEVCCHPIEVSYSAEEGALLDFTVHRL